MTVSDTPTPDSDANNIDTTSVRIEANIKFASRYTGLTVAGILTFIGAQVSVGTGNGGTNGLVTITTIVSGVIATSGLALAMKYALHTVWSIIERDRHS